MDAHIRPLDLFGDHHMIEHARVEYIQSTPDVTLRLARWYNGHRGTIHIFTGRTEYIEKYLDFVQNFVTRGFNVTVHDWRGQGRSTRNTEHPMRCHIEDFAQHQHDASVIMEATSDMMGPHYLYCHSMGGAIGLRYLIENKGIKAAIFSAPMWGIELPPLLEKIRPWAFRKMKKYGLQWSTGIGTRTKNYELHTRFRKNLLTSDPHQYKKAQNFLRQHPEINCGGPTYYWLEAAYREMPWLARQKSPNLPALVIMGDQEAVVAPDMIRKRIENTPEWRLVTIAGARHECFIDTPETRQTMWQNIDLFLDQFDVLTTSPAP